MTVAEAARALEVSPDLVYRLCRAGQLGHTRIGLGRGVIRLDHADVEAFRASRKVEAEPGPDEVEPEPRIIQAPRGRVSVPDIVGERIERQKQRARDRARAKARRS